MSKFGDSVKGELDHRKLQKLIDDGKLDAGDLANAEILSESRCCGAYMVGEEIGDGVLIRCSKCGAVQSPRKEDWS